MSPNERIAYLLEVYTSRKATALEEEELMEWMLEAQEDNELKTWMQGLWERHQYATMHNQVNWDGMFNRIVKDDQAISMPTVQKRLPWLRMAAAAAVLLLVVSGAWLMLNPAKPDQRTAQQEQPRLQTDVPAPAGNKAIISLADGKQVSLDSLQQGLLAQQGAVRVVKLAEGQIAYQTAAGAIVNELQYNKLYNPRGSKVIDMQLSDGSHVWLNAGSSIEYPVAFVHTERKVIITGEAYFEVAPNAKKPFKVVKDNMEITVLGTHFNVSAYDDDAAMQVTLLEGKVNVSNGIMKEQLNPGQQAAVQHDIKVRDDIDMDIVMAWKNGLFSFKNTSLEDMMRQIARWYDVTIKYEGSIPNKRFGGKIHRDANLSEVLKILEESNVSYRLNNKEIIIMR